MKVICTISGMMEIDDDDVSRLRGLSPVEMAGALFEHGEDVSSTIKHNEVPKETIRVLGKGKKEE